MRSRSRSMERKKPSSSGIRRRHKEEKIHSEPPPKKESKETPIFRGPEQDLVSLKEQKKIQIDIRRNIPHGKAGSSPIKRDIKDPLSVALPRREKEGRKCIFDREEIKNWRRPKSSSPPPKQRVVALRPEPIDKYEKKLVKDQKEDLRDRLNEDNRRKTSVHSRLGGKVIENKEEVIGRQELESRRPDVKPWEVDPEFVPRGRNYYEHDNREDASFPYGYRRGRSSFKFRGSFRGRARPRPYYSRRGGDGFFGKSRSDHLSSMEWKHDKYSEDGDEYRRP